VFAPETPGGTDEEDAMDEARNPAVNDASGISATPADAPIGAVVHGVDLAQPLGEEAFARILDLFHRHAVIVLRGQRLSPEELVAFSARFGALDVHHMTEHVFPDLPQVRVLSNEKKKDGSTAGITLGGMHWHSDLSYKPVTALATLLYGLECPAEGADTQFASTTAAYASLPEETKARLCGREAVHDRNFRYSQLYPNRAPLTAEQVSKVSPSTHPLVVEHPVTGAPALFVAKDVVSHVVGMDRAQGRALIDELEDFITRPAFVYAHRWQAGDLVVWDNRCTLHRATPYAFDRDTRSLWRTQVRGDAPRAFTSDA
jgi:taurine dioxygenase